MISLDTMDAVRAWLDSGASEPAVVLRLDLAAIDAQMAAKAPAGSVLLGCIVGPEMGARVLAGQIGIVSELGVLPRDLPAFGKGIYTVADLYQGMAEDGSGWEQTPDHRGFLFFNEKKNTPRTLNPAQMLAARIHDTVQQHAVTEFLRERDVVAIMGGHDFKRVQSPADVKAGKQDVYWECVEIAKKLTEAGFLVVTGGGPGVMEAGNLGALLAGSDDQLVAKVRSVLLEFGFESAEWRASAMKARKLILGSWNQIPPPERFSLGIPTWLYGHEPPNLFASHHSKMFYNSLREDGLVSYANGGIIFFEGNAGTVQEVFQDVTQNYYPGAEQSPTPMVFYNAGGYWERSGADLSWPTDVPMDKRKPLLPLVKQLAIEKKFMNSVFVTRAPGAVVDFLVRARDAGKVHKADVKLGNQKIVREHL